MVLSEATEQTFQDATHFLQVLSPLSGIYPYGSFIFRGQPSADLPLEPSAHRLNGYLNAPHVYGTNHITNGQQVAFEVNALNIFLSGCDASGIQVPGDAPKVRQKLNLPVKAFFTQSNPWPPRELHQVLAVAQHAGVPTCLLDWTRRAHIAAYFAASSALHMEKPPNHIAVWALEIKNPSSWKKLSLVDLPGGTNSNLAAQAGLFTVSHIRGQPEDLFEPSTLPLSLGAIKHSLKLHRLTIPYSFAPDLIKKCSDLGWNASTLFPGYEGAVRAVKDWAKLNRNAPDPNEIPPRGIFS